jgi:DNA-binding SARP family transcriptional activator/tetratricopeptide (TPR) repeat protein
MPSGRGGGIHSQAVEFRVLGPLQVWNDQQRVTLGGPQPEKVLATLLLASGQVVPLDALIDSLWDGEPPATAKHQVHKLIANLRRRIPGSIETDGPGYRIRLDNDALDATTFAERAAVPTIASLTAALALWRGPALAGIDSRTLQASAASLNERRLATIEALIDLRLAAGHAAEVAAQLPAMIAAHPLRETLRSRLMVALYRCGRQAEALSVYAETRALLADEVGLDPGPELIRLHQQLLRADPALEPPAPKAPCTLPYDLPDFHGRTADLDRLLGVAGAVVINAIDGMAGIGKTALAVHAAHRFAERYPDGQLFCDLHAHTPGAQPVEPDTALELLLRMLGVPPEAIPDGLDARTARWRAELAGRKVLVVLDNAASAAQVRPLLPGTPDCLVLVTSRRRLGMLDGAIVLSLDVLPAAEALELFSAVAGGTRATAEPLAAAEVVRLCGYLPLAIRIAATRLAQRPTWSVAFLGQRLQAETGRLHELAVQDRGVVSAFALSYADLQPAQQRMFRLLGLHPGADFDAYSAAAMACTSPRDAESLLEALVDTHLLRQPAAGRYSFHDLLREYARELAFAEGDEPFQRLHDYYLAVATAATDRINHEVRRFEPTITYPPRHLPQMADMDAALSWLAAEHANLLAMTAATGGWQLACVLRAFFEHRGHFADWRTTHERALRNAGADPLGTTLVRFSMGALAMWTGCLADGMDHFHHALACDIDRQLVATALTSLGMLAHLLHRDVEAASYLRQALAIEHDSAQTKALGWNNLGLAEGRLGQRESALAHHRRALALARQIGSRSAERGILLGLGETSLRLGLPAVQPFRQARELAQAGRFRIQEALALDGLAHATGDPAFWHQALAIFAELGVAQADLVRRHLDNPGVACCDLCRAASPVNAARPGLVHA